MTLAKTIQTAIDARKMLAEEMEKTIISHRCNGKLLSDDNAHGKKEC